MKKFYFYIAFYSNGKIRCFNTKFKPRPININGDGKLIKVVRFSKVFKEERK